MQSTIRATRTLPTRRFVTTTPTGRPASAMDRTTNLGAQTPGGYGGMGGPIPQAGGPPPPPPPKKSNMGLLVGVGALVAGAATYYLTQTADPSQAVKDDFHRLEANAKHEAEVLRAKAGSAADKLGSTAGSGTREAERFVDKLRSPDDRYGAEQLKDAVSTDAKDVKREASAWGSLLKNDAKSEWNDAKGEAKKWGNTLQKEERKAWTGFRDEVKAWGDALTSGRSEKEAWSDFTNEIRAYRDKLRGKDGEYGVAEVERYLQGRGAPSSGIDPKSNPYLGWIGGGRGLTLRKNSAERRLNELEAEGKSYFSRFASKLENEYDSLKSSASNAAHDAKREANSWLSFGEQKVDEAKYKTEAEYEKAKRAAKDEASAWSSWTSAKAADAQAAVNSAASSVNAASQDAIKATGDAAASTFDSAANATNAAAEKTKEEGSSWLRWGGAKAEEGKDAVKEGLLKAERGVEHGAQKAQAETKRL
ncbi:hypothetical protein JCM11251_004467 [Rhodosporidiobolus azoricus]